MFSKFCVDSRQHAACTDDALNVFVLATGELGPEQLLAAVAGKAAFKKSDLLVALFDSPVAHVEAALQALLKSKRVVRNGNGTFSVESGGARMSKQADAGGRAETAVTGAMLYTSCTCKLRSLCMLVCQN